MIVDTHVHVLAEDIAKYPRPSQGPAEQAKWPNFTGESIVETMDACGIDSALLVQAFHTYHFDNSYAIDVALKYPGRFKSVVVIDQSLPDAPDVITDLVENKGVRGVRLMKVQDGIYGDPKTFPLWQRMTELKIGVCFNKIVTADLPDLKAILDRFPDVAIALDHSWAVSLKTARPPYDNFNPLMELARYPNLYLKVAPNLTHDLIDQKGDSKAFWSLLVEKFGAERIMWGSNYPAHWNHYGKVPERLQIMRDELSFLSTDQQKWIFGETALRVWPSLKKATG